MIAVGHKAPFYMEIGVRLRIYKIEQFSSALELELVQGELKAVPPNIENHSKYFNCVLQ